MNAHFFSSNRVAGSSSAELEPSFAEGFVSFPVSGILKALADVMPSRCSMGWGFLQDDAGNTALAVNVYKPNIVDFDPYQSTVADFSPGQK
jgi:hypothetical protein